MGYAMTLRLEAFEILYAAGWSDTPIARALRMGVSTVKKRREERGLPRNPSRSWKIDETEAFGMYENGANDHEIARHFGMDPSGVVKWRQRRNLPSNVPASKPPPREIRQKARKMLRLGASRQQVMEALNLSNLEAVQRIRRKMNDPGLRRTGQTNQNIRAQIRRDDQIPARIERAIGAGLPREIRAEATAELYLAVLDGLVSADFIEKVAPSYRSRAYEICGGSRFGARSLSDEIAEDWTLMDTLDDPSALEEMEAAAEAAWNDN